MSEAVKSSLPAAPLPTKAPPPGSSPPPGSANDDHVIRAAITTAIRQCAKKRERIAEGMSDRLGVKVTAHMLYTFTAESTEKHRWPAAWTRAFCEETGDWSLLRVQAERAGFVLLDKRDVALLELAQMFVARAQGLREEAQP